MLKQIYKTALLATGVFLAPAAPGASAPAPGSVSAIPHGVTTALQKPDLFLYGCSRRVISPEGTAPNTFQIELNLVIENIGWRASKPSVVSLNFFLNGKVLNYDIPAIPYGSYGGIPSEIPPGSGNMVWTKNNVYHLKKVITPWTDIGPLDLSNGIIADITVDATNTNAERQEKNNTTTCDFSLGAG